jgi:hypothetical protein
VTFLNALGEGMRNRFLLVLPPLRKAFGKRNPNGTVQRSLEVHRIYADLALLPQRIGPTSL